MVPNTGAGRRERAEQPRREAAAVAERPDEAIRSAVVHAAIKGPRPRDGLVADDAIARAVEEGAADKPATEQHRARDKGGEDPCHLLQKTDTDKRTRVSTGVYGWRKCVYVRVARTPTVSTPLLRSESRGGKMGSVTSLKTDSRS